MLELAEKLKQYKSTFDASTPSEILETINRSVSLFQQESVCDSCLMTGSEFPAFTLKDLNGRTVCSHDLLKDKPLVVSFIRGGWCPYCVLELQAWQQYYDASFNDFNIVAITPELPEFACQVKKDNHISFPVLIDEELQLTKKLGLVWPLDDEMKSLLLKWDIDVSKRTCDTKFNLPVPATFVIDKNRVIQYRFIEEDYTIRAEPSEVLNIYRKFLD